MLVPMTKVHVIGHRNVLDPVLAAIHQIAAVQLIDVARDASVPLPPLAADEDQVRRIEDIRYLKTRLDSLLALCWESPMPAAESGVEIDFDQIMDVRRVVLIAVRQILGKLRSLSVSPLRLQLLEQPFRKGVRLTM